MVSLHNCREFDIKGAWVVRGWSWSIIIAPRPYTCSIHDHGWLRTCYTFMAYIWCNEHVCDSRGGGRGGVTNRYNFDIGHWLIFLKCCHLTLSILTFWHWAFWHWPFWHFDTSKCWYLCFWNVDFVPLLTLIFFFFKCDIEFFESWTLDIGLVYQICSYIHAGHYINCKCLFMFLCVITSLMISNQTDCISEVLSLLFGHFTRTSMSWKHSQWFCYSIMYSKRTSMKLVLWYNHISKNIPFCKNNEVPFLIICNSYHFTSDLKFIYSSTFAAVIQNTICKPF